MPPGINNNYHVASSRTQSHSDCRRRRNAVVPHAAASAAASMPFASSIHAKMKVLEAEQTKQRDRLDSFAASERRRLEASLRRRGQAFRQSLPTNVAASSSRNDSLHSNVSWPPQEAAVGLLNNYKVQEDERLARLLQLMQVVEHPAIAHWNVKPDENLDHGKSQNVVLHM